MRGYVYLIGSHTFKWYKIGKSLNAEARVRELGILLPFKIDVFAIWHVENHHLLETALHEKYADRNINGEWFKFTKGEVSELVSDPLLAPTRIFPSENAKPLAFSNLERDAPEGKVVQVRLGRDFTDEQRKLRREQCLTMKAIKKAARGSCSECGRINPLPKSLLAEESSRPPS